jgi:hypothetical protein
MYITNAKENYRVQKNPNAKKTYYSRSVNIFGLFEQMV